jgi:uncharacterized protein YqeY
LTLEETVNNELKSAMLSKDEVALRALRALKSALLLEKTSGSGKELDEATGVRIVQKLVKQRNDSIQIYNDQGRGDLAQAEQDEVKVLMRFMPKQMTDEEIREELKQIISKVGASGPSDTGKVMGMASKHFAGKADNRIVASIVKELLSG